MPTQYIDYTQLNCAERCEREYVYRYVQHLGSARPDASAHFGQVVHAAVRALYAGIASVAAILLAWGSPDNVPDVLDPERKPHLTRAYAERIAAMYAELYLPLKEWELVANERYLESSALGSCGIVDRVLRWHGDS